MDTKSHKAPTTGKDTEQASCQSIAQTSTPLPRAVRNTITSQSEVVVLLHAYLNDALKQVDAQQIEQALADFQESTTLAELTLHDTDRAAIEILRAIARLDPQTIVRVLRHAHTESGL
jgi:hypothetical protein